MNGAAGINRCLCRKKNQMIRQMSEEHQNKICEANYEQLPGSWNNLWSQIYLPGRVERDARSERHKGQ